MSQFDFPAKPIARPDAIIAGERYRFTILTDGLIRYEWAQEGKFEDRASVFAINREQPIPKFRVKETASELEVITKRFHLTYDKAAFTPSGFSVVVKGSFTSHASVWRYGDSCENLGGTARTLDGADGRIPLGAGVTSRRGFSTIDDSKSMLFDDNGFVATRLPGDDRVDGYLFAYGHDYRDAVKALYALSGPQPLLPRWALGNWWSRYYAYSGDEYIELIDKFRDEQVPLSVGVLDMDWHIVDDPRVAAVGKTGWTGYTWNKKLFPDPRAFLSELHKRKLKTALNDHPADGVQSYEDLYKDMAKALDHDTSNGDPIHFDITNRQFLDAFFNVLHRPFEEQGVDFWWIDWQQGEFSRIKGIDPLWMLNHYHFLDNARDNKRPLTFSRYAGPGSHRYPVGFSGDTIVSWASLDFQPEFTLTASNIGYGWWSHDIGGHWNGEKDDELATRWVQLGCFSPILRLHSSNNQWSSKEPWKFGIEAKTSMENFLRWRHRLLPYIYSMNAHGARENTPLIQPMYWNWPDRDEAYRAKNQYMFGSELMVVPITSPTDPKLRLARVKSWLPPGRHVDIFTGAVYDGNRELWMSRSLDGYPVFAKEGSIIPLDAAFAAENGCENPEHIEIVVVVGADGNFLMIEDDGSGSSIEQVKWTKTAITYTQKTGTLQIRTQSTASRRTWSLRFLALQAPSTIRASLGGENKEFGVKKLPGGVVIDLGSISPNEEVRVELGKNPELEVTDTQKHIWNILSDAQIGFILKEDIWNIVRGVDSTLSQVSRLHALEMDPRFLDAVLEYVLADPRSE